MYFILSLAKNQMSLLRGGWRQECVGSKSFGALQGIGVNTCQEIGSKWAGVRGSRFSVNIRITVGTLKNNKTKKKKKSP